MLNPQQLPSRLLPLSGEAGKESRAALAAPGGQQRRSYLPDSLHRGLRSTYPPHPHPAATSASSGPVTTPPAALCRANGMAELLVLERDVVSRVEQRAKDGSLIDLGWAALS